MTSGRQIRQMTSGRQIRQMTGGPSSPHSPAQRPEKNQGVPGTPKIHLIPPSRAGANRRSSNVGFEKSERGCLQNSILSHSSRKLPRESPRARPKRRPETPDFGPPPTRGPLAPGRIDCLGLKVPPGLSDKKSIKFHWGLVCAWLGLEQKNEVQLGPKIEKFGAPSPRKLVWGGSYVARAARRRILRGCLKPPVP